MHTYIHTYKALHMYNPTIHSSHIKPLFYTFRHLSHNVHVTTANRCFTVLDKSQNCSCNFHPKPCVDSVLTISNSTTISTNQTKPQISSSSRPNPPNFASESICISFSNRRRNNHNYYHQNPPSQLISSSPYPPPDPSYSSPPYIYSPPPPPPALPLPAPPPYHPYTTDETGTGPGPGTNMMMVRPNYGVYNHHPPPLPGYGYGWGPPMRPPPPPLPPPAYVEHNQAKKVKNHVNLHKDTLKVEVDKENPDCHLVSFVFDALFDGSITIYYFAKEEPDCKFVPVYPDAFVPVKVPFQNGIGQRFQQSSGTGIDLGFFDYDSLSKPSSGEDVYPLVICAETTAPMISTDEHPYDPLQNTVSTPRKQITQAVLEKNNGDSFKVRVMRQILWIDGVRYELREIYGIQQSEESFDDTGSGKECVICMTEPKDTAVLPCRHMCLCSECAKALRLQSNKCPVCRQPIEELMEIKVNSSDE